MSLGKDINQPVFRALSDPTRRAILELLADQPRSIGALVSHFEVSRPAIAKHLKVLEDAQLIAVSQQGRERINSFQPLALKSAADWMRWFDQFWDDRLERLKHAVEEECL